MLRAVRNIGLTGGFLVGGLVLELSSALAVRAVLLANGLSFAVLAAVVSTLRPAEPATRPPRTGSPAACARPGCSG